MRRLELELERPIPADLVDELSSALPYAAEGAANFHVDPERPAVVRFDVADAAAADTILRKVSRLIDKMTRGWRSLPPKVIADMRSVVPHHDGNTWTEMKDAGIVSEVAPGQVALSGLGLDLFDFFDRTFVRFAMAFGAKRVRYPQMISVEALNRCQYFDSFPHHVTFCTHLREDIDLLAAFSHAQEHGEPFPFARGLHDPEYVGVPAACFHVYLDLSGRDLVSPTVITTSARCFRYEAETMTTLERLWDFTMREIVFVGTEEWVREQRRRSMDEVVQFVKSLRLNGWMEVANDPFFVNTFVARKYYQLLTEAKFELKLSLPYTNGALAAASFNYHEDFFGRSFDVMLDGSPVHTGCTAFGIERWVFAFLSQYGVDRSRWPDVVNAGLAGQIDATGPATVAPRE